MNYKMIVKIVGKIMVLMALLMLLPLLVSIIYQEDIKYKLAFLIPIVALLGIGSLLSFRKLKNNKYGVKEGIIIVCLTWLLMALVGCLPFIISGDIPNFFDAFFEISSGFTTTGASIIDLNVTTLSNSIHFWRSFSHWIGGMGVLVFILAIIPESNDGSSIHILRAESPGPQVGKLVSKMKATSRILYLIYLCLSILEIIFLTLGPDKDMTFFKSIIYTMGTAGTGGFSYDATCLQYYTPYTQYVVAIFMIIFSINFTVFYLVLIGNIKEVVKNEEVKVFLSIIIVSVGLITANLLLTQDNNANTLGFEEAFRQSFFQVSSIISTTGYLTVDFSLWPTFSKTIIIILMVLGGCAGSTAGGLKISRVIMLFKSMIRKIKISISPRKVETIKMNGKSIEDETINGVQTYFLIYIVVLVLCAILISIDGHSLETNFTASLSCISNVGPRFGVAPVGTFDVFSNFSKFILSIEMIAGRLELLPILALFSKNLWCKN